MIAKCLAKHAPGLERFGLESGATSAWLWRELRQLGLPVICLDSRHAHRVLSMRRNKNDRNDARGLADLVRMGWYREARVRSIDAQFVRSLLLSRQQLLQSRRNIENQIRGALKTLGVMTGQARATRFTSSTKVGPYLGLTPRQYQSGESEWIGGIGKSNDPLLRSYLYEAAGVLMTLRRSCPLKAMGLAACQAHRLEARLHRRGAQARCHPSRHLARRHRVRVERGRAGLSLIEELPHKRKASLPGRRAD